MRLRGLSPKTVESYLGRLKLFLKYFNDRPIEEMNEIEIREYLLYLLDSGHSAGSVNVCNSALRFIFGAVLGRNLNYQIIHRQRTDEDLHPPRKRSLHIALPAQLEVLRAYWKEYRPNHPEGYLFYPRKQRQKVLTPRLVANAFRNCCRNAGLPDTYTVHTLRHICWSLEPKYAKSKDCLAIHIHSDNCILSSCWQHEQADPKPVGYSA